MRPVDFLNLGLGAAFLAKDKVEEVLTELEKRGEVNKEDATKFIADAKERAEKERDALDARVTETVREKVQEVVAELGLATKEDIEQLKKLIEK